LELKYAVQQPEAVGLYSVMLLDCAWLVFVNEFMTAEIITEKKLLYCNFRTLIKWQTAYGEHMGECLGEKDFTAA
jgi:hypothetical protein